MSQGAEMKAARLLFCEVAGGCCSDGVGAYGVLIWDVKCCALLCVVLWDGVGDGVALHQHKS